MKRFRYLAIALSIVAILVTVVWVLRNSIVQRISSPILANYDIELVDVSFDALAAGAASIGYLELVHAKGTTIVIEDLTLPIGSADNAIKSYSAQHVTIVTTTRDDGAPFELARLINQFLSLSDTVAGNAIHIAEFDLPPYPSIRDLRWTITDNEQHINWTVESVDISVATNRSGEDTYDVSFSADTASSINGKLQQTAQGISIVGQSMLELSNWQAMAKLTGALPDAVEISSGMGELQFEAEIPLDVSQSPTLNATLTPSSPWQIGYGDELGDSTDVLVTSGSALDIRATFPEVDWSLQQADLSLLVTNNAWNEIPLSVSGLACRSGPTCSMGVDVTWLDPDTPFGSAAKISLSSDLEVTFPVEGADWRLSADAIDAGIESLSLSSDITLDFPVYLDKVKASGNDGIVSASTGAFIPSIRLAVDKQSVAVPGIKGRISLQDSNIAFDLATVDLHKDGTISGQHDLDSGVGGVAILDTALTFNEAPLSSRVAPWENDFDISAGNLAVDLRANWASTNSGFSFEARSSMQIDALAGFYADIAFVGFSTDIELDYNAAGITVAPTSITVDLVDMGLPIEDITADVEVDIHELAVAVDNLQLSAFDGVVSAAPFSFRTGRDVNNVILTAKEIELSELLSIKEFAAVTVTGTIGAVLPITFGEDGISIEAGTLTGEAPGGVIRYLGSGGPDSTDMSSLGLATAALSNFEYESLTADVNYSKAGDLKLQMQIKGRNPELDDGRPVVLNLGVENNVPQMLKSLQAARAVEEILEKQFAD